MKLKALKLNKLKSAVVLNDHEKKAVHGGYWGDSAGCTLSCHDSGLYILFPHGDWITCLAHGSGRCGDGNFTCSNCN